MEDLGNIITKNKKLSQFTWLNGLICADDLDIDVLYQPIVDLKKSKVIKVEALVRFIRDGGLLAPGEVLPYLNAEQISKINWRVYKQAVRDVRFWHGLGVDIKVSVNIEIFQLQEPTFAKKILKILNEECVSPSCLILEILEGRDLKISSEIVIQMIELRRSGVQFALDDVGCAYSGLTRIKDLPVDVLKLDRSFIEDIYTRPGNLNFVQAIFALSRSLSKELVVEGVEDFVILSALDRLGISQVQGYVFSKPLKAADIPSAICDVRVPQRSVNVAPNDWIGAYAELLHERERLTAMLRYAPEMLDSRSINDTKDNILEACFIMVPTIYSYYCQQRFLISRAKVFHDPSSREAKLTSIEEGYKVLLELVQEKILQMRCSC